MWVTLTKDGRTKRVKNGVAFWMVVLGPIYALFKGDWLGTLILLVCDSVLSIFIPGMGILLALLINALYSTYWSRSYIKRLRENGWQ